MSLTPEAPQAPDKKQGSTDFDKNLHPTDGIRPFNRDGALSEELVGRLEERGVPHANTIDPVTLGVEVDKINLSPNTSEPIHTAPELDPRTPNHMAPPALPSNTETAEQPPKNHRSLWVGIGATAASATAAVALTLGLTGGDKVQAGPVEQETTSVTPSPIENENESPDGSENIDPTEGIEILKPSGTAQEVLGDFANRITSVINARADGGGVISDNLDLQYLTNAIPGTPNPALNDFQNFVSNMTSNVLEARSKGAQQGIDVVNIGVVSTYVESEPTSDGGFIIESVDEYWAIGEDGQSIGDIILNDEPHRYTFSRANVVLPDGSLKNTFVLTGFENGSANPVEVLN